MKKLILKGEVIWRIFSILPLALLGRLFSAEIKPWIQIPCVVFQGVCIIALILFFHYDFIRQQEENKTSPKL